MGIFKNNLFIILSNINSYESQLSSLLLNVVLFPLSQ